MINTEINYRAPWSKGLIGLSLFSIAVIVGASVLMFGLGRAVHSLLAIQGWLILSVLPISALFVVRGYGVRDGELIVQRLLWSTIVPLQDLRQAYHDPNAMRKSFKTFGNGGCFSFTGWFYNRTLGHFRAFATSPDRSVVLVFLARNSIVVTPEHPEQFEAFLHSQFDLELPEESRDREPVAV